MQGASPIRCRPPSLRLGRRFRCVAYLRYAQATLMSGGKADLPPSLGTCRGARRASHSPCQRFRPRDHPLFPIRGSSWRLCTSSLFFTALACLYFVSLSSGGRPQPYPHFWFLLFCIVPYSGSTSLRVKSHTRRKLGLVSTRPASFSPATWPGEN